jgi:hypothetical protein
MGVRQTLHVLWYGMCFGAGNRLPPGDIIIFSDGSERHIDGEKYVGYGYVIYQNGRQIAVGYRVINSLSHVFDAEAVGAWNGLQCIIQILSDIRQGQLWLCIDSTSVIWCICRNASSSS